jgi:peptide/nickel transport system permease protein
VFIMVRSVPGDVVDLITGEYGAADKATKEAIRKDYSLDKNVAVQYVEWLGGLVFHRDLGKSIFSNRTISSELKNRLPVTFELSLLAIFFAVCPARGHHFRGPQDTGGYAEESLRATAPQVHSDHHARRRDYRHRQVQLTHRRPDGNLRCSGFRTDLGLASMATRSTMLEVLRQDYIRTAWSKGLRERVIIIRHALRNALIPVITVVGLQLPILVGGTVIIETVYSIPGMGRYYVDSVNRHDYPVIQSINLVVACVVVFANLGVDVLYSIVDPRIR